MLNASDRFVRAALSGNLQVVQDCLAEGFLPDVKGRPGKSESSVPVTPLYAAALGSHVHVMKALLDAGANPNLVVTGETVQHRTALNAACAVPSIEAIDLLLSYGADPRIRDVELMTAAHALLVAWAGANYSHENGDQILRDRLLAFLAKGNPVNQPDNDGDTLLGLAVATHVEVEVLSMLLDQGANPHRTSVDGGSVVQVAVKHDNESALQFFLEREVSPSLVNDRGRTALFYVTDTVLERMLLKFGAEVDHQDADGSTPLAHLLTYDYPADCVSVLLDAGADLDRANHLGVTPRDIARQKKNGQALLDMFSSHEAKRAMKFSAQRPRAACHS